MPDDVTDDRAGLTARLQSSQDDPPPEALLAAVRAAYSWRSLDTDLCRPTYDSLLDETLSVRGHEDARMLHFEQHELALDLEVTVEPDKRVLVGHVTPPAVSELTIRHGGANETVVTSDELGRFVLDNASGGPLSVRCTTGASDTTLTTDWVLI